MIIPEVAEKFKAMGGEFVSPPFVLSKKLKQIKVLVFDWDGVWHSGRKNGNGESSFSEVDSMGLNMLRFGYYLQNGEIPITLIITGEQNHTAFDFAEREHIDGVFFKAKNKLEALAYAIKKWHVTEEEVLFAFDDILDLGMASKIGAGFLINRAGSPLFSDFVIQNKWCDYKTFASGDNHGVREVCELCLGLMGQFENAVINRMNYSATYAEYFQKRNGLKTSFFTQVKKAFASVPKP